MYINPPYVYKLTHKESGQFYFGFRYTNKLAPALDLGHKYFSSSKKVKELGFNNFNIEIVMEFQYKDRELASDLAYDYEQILIRDDFENDLCLNGFYLINGKKRFRSNIVKPESRIKMSASAKLKPPVSDNTRAKMSASQKLKKMTDEAKSNMSKGKMGHEVSKETRHKLRDFNLGKKDPEETRLKKAAAITLRHTKTIKKFRVISPTGEIFEDTYLQKFCIKYNLKLPSMSQLCKGTLMQYKGWTGSYIEKETI